ncbi:hypothetical protein DYB38_002451 [Aphanomyces astaci]|uniref:Uncharacterized protein n=2 Tax=Aphanomyces astaci TaxID=112090 RepID=A0A397DZ15_APHAT|nr:hypothetical protein DYB38_002451 [Aphanomyces astaci]
MSQEQPDEPAPEPPAVHEARTLLEPEPLLLRKDTEVPQSTEDATAKDTGPAVEMKEVDPPSAPLAEISQFLLEANNVVAELPVAEHESSPGILSKTEGLEVDDAILAPDDSVSPSLANESSIAAVAMSSCERDGLGQCAVEVTTALSASAQSEIAQSMEEVPPTADNQGVLEPLVEAARIPDPQPNVFPGEDIPTNPEGKTAERSVLQEEAIAQNTTVELRGEATLRCDDVCHNEDGVQADHPPPPSEPSEAGVEVFESVVAPPVASTQEEQLDTLTPPLCQGEAPSAPSAVDSSTHDDNCEQLILMNESTCDDDTAAPLPDPSAASNQHEDNLHRILSEKYSDRVSTMDTSTDDTPALATTEVLAVVSDKVAVVDYNFPAEAFGIFEEISGDAALAGLEDNDYLVCITVFPLRLLVSRWSVDVLQYESFEVKLESWDGVGLVLPIEHVNAVYDNSPADNGGLMAGDLVFWVTDLPTFPTLDSVSDWIGTMYSASLAVEMHVYRYSTDEARYDELVLQIQPDRWCAPQLQLSSAVRRNVELLGVDLIYFDIAAPQVIYPPFLLVEHVIAGSPAADAGLVAGDWIGKLGQLTAAATTTTSLDDDLIGQVHLYIDKAMSVQLSRYDSTSSDGLIGCQLTPWAPQDMTPFLVVQSLPSSSSLADPALEDGDLILRLGDHVHDHSMQDVSHSIDAHDTGGLLLVLQRWDPTDMAYKTFPVVVATTPHHITVWTLDSVDFIGWHCVVYEAYWAQYEETHPAELPCKECWATAFSTVAHAAAYAGHDPCLRYLGEYFDVFVADTLGRTPLFYACYANQVECIQLLLGLDYSNLKESIDSNGDTPLHAATSGGALAAIALLLQAGCNPEPINYSGYPPTN